MAVRSGCGIPLPTEAGTPHLPPPMFFRLLSKLFNKREGGAGPKQDGDVVKPFLDHLEDLRWTIVKMVVTLVIGMAVCFVFAADIVKLLQWPIHWAGIRVVGASSNPAVLVAEAGNGEGRPKPPPTATMRLIERIGAKGVL